MTDYLQQPAYTKASRKRRMAAFLIDHILFTFLIAGIVFLLIMPAISDDTEPEGVVLTLFLVIVPLVIAYMAKDAVRGISPGKWIAGIMVRDADDPEQVPSVRRLLIRNIFIVMWPVEFLVLALSPDKRRIGDKLAQTIVVNNPVEVSRVKRVLLLVVVVFAFCVVLFVSIIGLLKNTSAYDAAIKAIEQNSEIRTRTGGIKGYGWLPAGRISTMNGEGTAVFEIEVQGVQKNISVSVYLEKHANEEWQVLEIRQ